MLNIAPYIAKYVRSLHAREEHLQIPYSQSQFGVTLMVDVVGFSTLTTKATAKGDSGAEAVALEIGTYMGECIEIIEHFGGDVVKFLGDAVLVCFQADKDEEIDEEKQKPELVKRAIECGLQLLSRLSHYRVYLTAEERSRHRSSLTGDFDRQNNQRFLIFDSSNNTTSSEASTSKESLNISSVLQLDHYYPDEYSTSFNFWNCVPLLFGRGRKKRVHAIKTTSNASDTTRVEPNAIDLELHIALSCGIVTNVILGDPDVSIKTGKNMFNKLAHMEGYGRTYSGRLEYAICGPAVESLEDALSAAKGGEMSLTREAFELSQPINMSYQKRNQFYVVKNSSSKKRSYNSQKPQGVYRHKFNSVDPLIPPTPDTTSCSELPLDQYFSLVKYINRSALYRLEDSTDDNFPAQFRDATIMFISLGKLNPASPEGTKIAQRSVHTAIQVLMKYEGILQQFAVDDKGATILAVFGLPPLSHEREAVFAAKAAIELRDAYHDFLDDFAISLSTGVIFTAVLPHSNPYRRDPAIAGDTIILAVRMLKFPFSKKNIVCDSATKQQIGRTCEFEDYGEKFVKGKVKPISIFGIIRFAAFKPSNKRISATSQDNFIGYKSEMMIATDFVEEWNETPNHHMLVISGPSGVGKSFFAQSLSKKISGSNVIWSSSTEVEKSSKYYLAKNVILALFEIIDSNQVPQNTKRRSYNFNSSGGFFSGDSSASFESSPTTTTHTQFPEAPNFHNHHTTACMENPENADCSNEIAGLVTRCLRICGEQDEFLPLFKVIFANLADFPDNRYIQRLDSRGRDVLLIGLMTRMIKYVSDHVNLVFVLDDVQWADSASIRVLQHVHEQCQRVLLILATRPVKDYSVAFIKNFRETGSSEEIKLNGLGAAEIGEIILHTFQTAGVKSVSPEIVRVIQKRTAGNPLYVKNVAIVLKDFNHVTVVDGVLVPSSNRFDLEDLLGNFDYKRIIKMQFDRIDGRFQEFLTVASCLDQYFTIEEVQSVLKVSNTEFKYSSSRQVQEKVEIYDVYHFIQKVDDTTIRGLGGDIFTFTHITIPQCIYDMVSYETRILYHRLLAKYYEGELTRENYTDLLGKVTRHYLQTDWIDKQLFYLEALADLNMKSYLMPEATANLEKMVQILGENEDIAAKFGRIHQSDIYRRLGMCFTMRTKLQEGEQFLFQALDCLGQPWPQSEPEFLFKFWKNRIAQFRHRKLRVLHRNDKEIQIEIRKRVVEIMTQLSNIYFYTGKGRSFVYTCLVGLNACERLNEVGPSYTLFLARNSLLSWLNDEKQQSIFYITKALRCMDAKNDPDTLTICSHLCFAAGKFNNARELLYQSIDAIKTLGVITDCQAFYRSVGLVVTMRVFEGTLDNSPDDLLLLKEMANTAHSNCDFEAEVMLSVYQAGNCLIMDRLRECEPFVALLEVHLKQSADYSQIAIHGTLLFYYARIKNYEAARRHTRTLVTILPLLTVTPNIFPIFGLIFATMGLYCMIEDDKVDIVSTGDVKMYNRFISGVSKLNHAFQQVKFWEFAQPCLYLARALPYISTGRIVEGFTVLQHGVMEMQFIQEIRFLKAYYWANLGKYAFTPEDRAEWTKRAMADFDELNIPAHVYCNPDPMQSYSKDIPVDFSA